MKLFISKKSLSNKITQLEKELFITNRRLLQIENLIIDGKILIQDSNQTNTDTFKDEFIKSIEGLFNAL